MAKKLQLAFVGTGGICNHKHIPALLKLQDKVEIVALCDIDRAKAEKTAKDFGLTDAKIYTDYHEMLKDDNIDVVHVCTPNVSHCEITVAAFEAGKHVYCEKPMAAKTEDAEKMLAAWRKSGKKFTVGYQNRFRYDVQVLKKACDAGDLGDIYYAEANAIRRKAVPTWGVFPDKSKQGGGPLIDIGTHALDITLWCMNNYDVDSVSGQVFYKLGNDPEAAQGNTYGPWDAEHFEVEDSAMGFIKMKNGALINLRASWALNYLDAREASTTLCGTKEGAEIKHGGSYPKSELWFNHTRHGKMMTEFLSGEALVDYFEGVNEPPADVDMRQWTNAILNDTEPCVKPEEAFRITQILDTIYKAAATNTTIKL
ncbi:Gfo/Idh/MocA family protein [Mitsuokella multacida]|uniref:Oxidoreductase, NAD-binding domain protein n=1 Tax=Mitsuokella multacida DSM 20544 TaxID=500635 RepID=C9KQL1_9FIRM|nr:Gfo/Idh/MocA family oxidoreductase [Mitsuokella multacida]EEX67787.1 oxidoreductase, NAD-binding domain protein [Mitsuokella multacida DSM 20544]